MSILLKQPTVLPGFGLTLGFTLFYLSLIVLIPLAGLFVKTSALTWDQFWQAVSDPRTVASYQLTFGLSFVAALINAFFGVIIAWSSCAMPSPAGSSWMRWSISPSRSRPPWPASP